MFFVYWTLAGFLFTSIFMYILAKYNFPDFVSNGPGTIDRADFIVVTIFGTIFGLVSALIVMLIWFGGLVESLSTRNNEWLSTPIISEKKSKDNRSN